MVGSGREGGGGGGGGVGGSYHFTLASSGMCCENCHRTQNARLMKASSFCSNAYAS